MRFAAAAFAAFSFASSALATITITGPTEDFYWVQNASNFITWTLGQGDPSPVSILITNGNDTSLNGGFSIAEFVDLSAKTFTVTNVTLKVADGYQVNFINPQNASQVYATSQTFPVKAPGTAIAPTASAAASAAGASSTSPSSSSSSSGTPNPTGGAKTGAASAINAQNVFGILAACGIAGLSAVLL